MRTFLSGLPALLLGLIACNQSPPQSGGSARGERTDSAQLATTRDSLIYVRESLPRLAAVALSRPAIKNRYELFTGLNPYYERGRFDDDTAIDVAVQIIEKATGKRGVLIVHGRDSSVHVIGAGTPFGNGGDDFTWLWIWRVEPRTFRPDISPAGRELLYVEKPESAGGVIWWDGSGYVWTQHGD